MKEDTIQTPMNGIRVLVVDDSPMFMRSAVRYLEHQDSLDLVGTAESGATALAGWRMWRPEVILVDLAMPEMNGLELIRRLQSDGSAAGVIAISLDEAEGMVSAALTAGAQLFVAKSEFAVRILAAIYEVAGEIRRTALGSG